MSTATPAKPMTSPWRRSAAQDREVVGALFAAEGQGDLVAQADASRHTPRACAPRARQRVRRRTARRWSGRSCVREKSAAGVVDPGVAGLAVEVEDGDRGHAQGGAETTVAGRGRLFGRQPFDGAAFVGEVDQIVEGERRGRGARGGRATLPLSGISLRSSRLAMALKKGPGAAREANVSAWNDIRSTSESPSGAVCYLRARGHRRVLRFLARRPPPNVASTFRGVVSGCPVAG